MNHPDPTSLNLLYLSVFISGQLKKGHADLKKDKERQKGREKSEKVRKKLEVAAAQETSGRLEADV